MHGFNVLPSWGVIDAPQLIVASLVKHLASDDEHVHSMPNLDMEVLSWLEHIRHHGLLALQLGPLLLQQ